MTGAPVRSGRETRWFSVPNGRGHVARTVAALVVGVGIVGCAADDAAQSAADGLALRLVLPDTNIREPDVPCSGARAFRFAHPGANFTIQDGDGNVVATGTLPEGVAEPAFTFDMGDSRQPTICVMTLPIDGVTSLDGHELIIDERRPVAIVANPNLDDVPEAVLR